MSEPVSEVVAVPADRGVLLEREAELGVAQAALEQAALGCGSGLLIQGPAGVGKSRLLTEIGALASARGMTVLRARGGTLERDYRFGAVRQLLGPLPLLDAAAGATGSPDANCGILDALHRTVVNRAAGNPILLSVDDAQWLDTPSLRLLEFLSHRLEDLPLVLVVAGHPGSDGTPDDVLAGLQAGRLLTPLQPAPLSRVGVGALVADAFAATASPDFVDACHRRTGGNPFFLVELLRECAALNLTPNAPEVATRVAAMAPRAVGAVVKARLTRLGHQEALLAQALTTLGDGAEFVDVAALTGLPIASAAAAVGALAGAGFLADGNRLAFTHPLVSEVIRSDVPAVRAQRHADAARLLHARGRDPETVAAHVQDSPRSGDDWAVQRLCEAARAAVARAAPEVAVGLLGRALAEPPSPPVRAAVLVELGTVQAAVHPEEAIASLTEAQDALPAGSQRAAVGLALARLLAAAGRPVEADAAITDARAFMGPGDRRLALALDAAELRAAGLHPGAEARRQLLAQRAADLAGDTPAERALLAAAAFQLTQELAPEARVRDLVARALGDGPGATEDSSTPTLLAAVLCAEGQLQQSIALSTRLIDQADARGSVALAADASAVRAHAHWRGGNLRAAEADAGRALAIVGHSGGQTHAWASQALIGVLTDRGQLELARAAAEAAPERSGDPHWAGVACARARLELALGDVGSALARATAAGEVLDAVGWVNPVAGEWRHTAALAQLGLGRRAAAATVLAPALTAARRSGGAYGLGLSLWVAALVAQPVSLELLADAHDVLAGSEFSLLQAHVLVDLGSALRRSGRRREARQPLAEGIEVAAACGAQPLVERARTELLAAGSRPRRIERSGTAALTPSEHRAATLAADGLSNREIAQRLFVSIRTVESQLRSTYQKLGITSREQLGAAIGGRVPDLVTA